MNSLKLSYRIALGFGALLAIALLLGGFAALQMSSTTRSAQDLANAKVPEVAVANEVERASLLTMYEIRGYGLTGEDTYLQSGLKHLAEVKDQLKAAKELAAKNTGLDQLRTAAEKAEAKVLEYERLVNDTAANDKLIDANRTEMDNAAKAFMANSYAYLENQDKKFAEEAAAKVAIEKLVEREDKMNLMNDIIDAGNAVRLSAWRAQAERNPKIIEEGQKNFATIKTNIDSLRPITRDAANQAQLELCQSSADGYRTAMNGLLKAWITRDELGKRRAEVANAVLDEAQNTAAIGLKDTGAVATQSATSLSTTTTIMLIGLGIATLVGISIAFFMTRSIANPVQAVAVSLAAGAQQTSAAAGQVASTSQSLAEGASQQAASLEETSSSLEELASMTRRNTENAQKVNDLAKQARAAGDAGSTDMQQMTAAMNDIKTSSDEIAKIIKTIDEIAFQTNILALNAAVEAARAGEAGMGFAVVADEVRALAQRSAQASKETSSKIDGAITNTQRGVLLSAKVASSLNEIVAKAREVDELAAEVANASKEQSQGIEQINKAVGEMDKVTQANAAGAEESASASEELSSQAVALSEAVSDLQRLVDGHKAGAAAHSSANTHAHAAKPSAHHQSSHAKGSPASHSHAENKAIASPKLSHSATAGQPAHDQFFKDA